MTSSNHCAWLAFRHLLEVAKQLSVLSGSSSLYALTWLAAGRLVACGQVPGVPSIANLVEVSAWRSLQAAGLPDEALDVIGVERNASDPGGIARRATAAEIVHELHRQTGPAPWDVLDSAVAFLGGKNARGEVLLLPQLADLMLDLLGEPDGELWIPFDYSGQLTVCALRRGWRVLALSPVGPPGLMARLLLIIESGLASHPDVRFEVSRDGSRALSPQSDFLLVNPPFGMQVRGSRLEAWDTSTGRDSEQFARSESWAVNEFLNRAGKRAVFLLPQGVLFAKGQEQRLRESLLRRGGPRNQVEAVIALPPGAFTSLTLAGGILVTETRGCADNIRMVDLGSGRRAVQDAAAILLDGHEAALGRAEVPEKVKLVSHEEIASNEFSFAPSRYLRRISDLGVNSLRLEDICAPIRPPTTAKDPTPEAVAEVGLHDLGKWTPSQTPFEKTVFLKTRTKDTGLVQPGDIVISIKGSVGRSALMGEAVAARPTVVSQSCLALRLNANTATAGLTPEYLLMYLRSPQGQAQLDSLQVGAGVQHISPSTLLGALLVPTPTAEEAASVVKDFHQLCEMEARLQQLQSEMTELATHRWTAEAR